ncbi:ADP-ribosylation factor GTPase-activating protein 1 [Elysia marginata]|uniref:ADP-ribosylation factor GTPase-activating protein 1 n=1 Tax=Elysia marginata TaxID=1093978 RepID=A0AAV4HV20_9GAST|nr:ADP-ribosylation factor GTPase-activating protein 1 [Elysia marginata]
MGQRGRVAVQLGSITAQKTKELSSTVNDSVLKPTAEKVKDGKLLNEVGTSMSGFASKLSAAGTKGWKDLQSLWGEPKTTLNSADTSPGEKSSLLSRGSYGSGDDSSKGHLLGEEDDSWGDWGNESDWSNSSAKKNVKNKDSGWSAGNEDDFEAWLNDDTSTLSLSSSSKTKSGSRKKGGNEENDNDNSRPSSSSGKHKSSKKKTSQQKPASDGWDDADWGSLGDTKSGSSKKQKQPLVGNLLDLDDNYGNQGGDGWDNEVWAADEDDDWQTLELDAKH